MKVSRIALQRVLLAAAALVIGGWLAVSLAGARALEGASDVSSALGAPSAALEQAVLDAERAGELRPADTEPDLVRARLFTTLGRRDESLALFRAVARREPDNLRPWVGIDVLSGGTDERARARRRQLDPLTAP